MLLWKVLLKFLSKTFMNYLLPVWCYLLCKNIYTMSKSVLDIIAYKFHSVNARFVWRFRCRRNSGSTSFITAWDAYILAQRHSYLELSNQSIGFQRQITDPPLLSRRVIHAGLPTPRYTVLTNGDAFVLSSIFRWAGSYIFETQVHCEIVKTLLMMW